MEHNHEYGFDSRMTCLWEVIVRCMTWMHRPANACIAQQLVDQVSSGSALLAVELIWLALVVCASRHMYYDGVSDDIEDRSMIP